MTLPDAAARARIAGDLEINLLVEAGAGSGKTTALVGRMVALVRSGVPVESIVAVTFTRKAAGELRERFQDALEAAALSAPPGDEDRLHEALRRIDRGFMGTIHAFCARLLRERPLDAGLDPDFTELTAARERTLSREWWEAWLERLTQDGDPSLGELEELGIPPETLHPTFVQLNDALDVRFPTPDAPAPGTEEIDRAREGLEALLDAAEPLLPREEPEKGWGGMQAVLRTVWFMRRSLDWSDRRIVLDALGRVVPLVAKDRSGFTWNRWPGPLESVKELAGRFADWGGPGTSVARLHDRWLEHRYAPAVRFARRASEAFARYRHRTGHLSFHDLLRDTARLLREHPEARRDLGTRFGRILVDEFQDTDPLQAEILFLLTSDPDESPAEDWLAGTPRPGSLFVVGDPKQSIYRFRRADIALYQEVRDRFDPELGGMGDVLQLTANFRSLPSIAALVNETFRAPDRFPPLSTERQAAFAPMEPRRTEEGPGDGVWGFIVPDTPEGKGGSAPEEAAALAQWIAARVVRGERAPGDVMILTRTKRALDTHARALEAWGLPVEVSGSGVGPREELEELLLLLQALADPGDPVKVTAALTGIFFGLDLLEVLELTAGGRDPDPRRPVEGDGAGPEALRRLGRWWETSRRVPADVLVQGILADTGLLPWVVAGELGGVRGGVLAYALDLIRGAGLDGDTSLTGALAAVETGLQEEEWEAPLEPGRTGGVRLMNLHKAKGLEAPVVILADPYRRNAYPARFVVQRAAGEEPVGWLEIGTPGTYASQFDTLAQPPGWTALQETEAGFEEAEEVRLLYVAASRARDELVVVQPGAERKLDASPWSLLHDGLGGEERQVDGVLAPPPPRSELPVEAETLTRRAREVDRERERRGEGGIEVRTVTAVVKGAAAAQDEEHDEELRPVYRLSTGDATGPGGSDWGSAVHATLEAAAREIDDDTLRAVARSALLERDRPVRDGEPTELDLLLAVVERVRSSRIWARAQAAERCLVEHPFLVQWQDGVLLEGVVDLLFREPEGWVLVDYKTDPVDEDFQARLPRYQEQVRHYADAWRRMSGEPIKEALVFRIA